MVFLFARRYNLDMKKVFFAIMMMSVLFIGVSVSAETSPVSVGFTEEAILSKVIAIEKEGINQSATMFESGAGGTYQILKVKFLKGVYKNAEVTIYNDFHPVKVGQKFYTIHLIDAQGTESYTMGEPYRIPQLAVLLGLFLITTLLLGGIKGIRGIISLMVSLFIIVYVLIPLILGGYPPLWISILISSFIVVVGSYITHGLNRTTTSAVIGMVATVIITGLFAYFAVHFTQLTGSSSEELFYLKQGFSGNLDVIGLLLGAIMIGLLGVLYDVSIGQAITVEELLRISPQTPKMEIYKRAINVGKGHIGALVDTLAIAYVGASLPLLLLFSQNSTYSVMVNINRDVFATEIVRTIVGSIGLIIAVPITTYVAVYILDKKYKQKNSLSPLYDGIFEIDTQKHIHTK